MKFWRIQAPKFALIAADDVNTAIKVYEDVSQDKAGQVTEQTSEQALQTLVGRMHDTPTIPDQILEARAAIAQAKNGDVIALSFSD